MKQGDLEESSMEASSILKRKDYEYMRKTLRVQSYGAYRGLADHRIIGRVQVDKAVVACK